MAKRIRKALKISIIVIAGFAVIGILLNTFLMHELKQYLQKELPKIVYKETDGFYDLSFTDLNIDFFSGELLIEGIRLHPNQETLARWKAQDSLPAIRADLSVGSIYFKGVNLTWRRNYKTLNFDLFEIKDVDTHLYETQVSEKNGNEHHISAADVENLYAVISPYISELTVEKMNLENASIAYHLGEDSDSTTYALKDIDFHIYGFRLDEHSSESGKLLYSDNFEFKAEKAQALLQSERFNLTTGNILLDTRDSIILFEGIQFNMYDSIRPDYVADSYVNAAVGKVAVKGIYFKRENSLNYLDARSFDISSANIRYFNAGTAKSDTAANAPVQNVDSLLDSWSLYELVSPLLHRVVIERIGIDSTQLEYCLMNAGKEDVFEMEDFTFTANHFRIDSLSHDNPRQLYSNDFSFSSKELRGNMVSRNHKIRIKNIDVSFDSLGTGKLGVDTLRIKPIDTTADYDCLSGTVRSLSVEGLRYMNAVEIDWLTIDKPVVSFEKSAKRTSSWSSGAKSQEVINNIFSPLFGHLLIKNIRLTDTDFKYLDKRTKETFRIKNLYLNAQGFLANKSTVKHPNAFFDYLDFQFSFDKFFGYFPQEQHTLDIGNASFDSQSGNLKLKELRINPRMDDGTDMPDMCYTIFSPSLTISKLFYDERNNAVASFAADSLIVQAPQIKVVKRNAAKLQTASEQPANFPSINIAHISIDSTDLVLIDKPGRDSLHLTLSAFTSQGVTTKGRTLFGFSELYLARLDADIWHSGKESKLSLDKLEANDFAYKATLPDSYFKIGHLNIDNPYLLFQHAPLKGKGIAPLEQQKQDLYTTFGRLAQTLEVGNLNIRNSNITYHEMESDSLKKQFDLHDTDLMLKGLALGSKEKSFFLEDISFDTHKLAIPIDNGFYTLKIDDLNISKTNAQLNLRNIRLEPAYPMMEFAYKHPKHKDWFDVKVGDIRLSGIDIAGYFSDKVLRIASGEVNDVELLNFKNKQIKTESRLVPMIYEGLQKLPVKLDVKDLKVSNFGVVYEELVTKATEPGKIFFTKMNGRFSGFTNVATEPNQYIRLDADGKLMGTGYFTATWQLPVDTAFDSFLLDAHLTDFDFVELNQIVQPMFPTVRIASGYVHDLWFNTAASSERATVDMTLLYNNLKVDMYKQKDGELVENRFVTGLANRVLKENNPDKRNKAPRQPEAEITRNPYRSTFNYIWQILQPPVVESVGISKEKQDFFKGIANIITRIKHFFKPPKKEAAQKKEDEG